MVLDFWRRGDKEQIWGMAFDPWLYVPEPNYYQLTVSCLGQDRSLIGDRELLTTIHYMYRTVCVGLL